PDSNTNRTPRSINSSGYFFALRHDVEFLLGGPKPSFGTLRQSHASSGRVWSRSASVLLRVGLCSRNAGYERSCVGVEGVWRRRWCVYVDWPGPCGCLLLLLSRSRSSPPRRWPTPAGAASPINSIRRTTATPPGLALLRR